MSKYYHFVHSSNKSQYQVGVLFLTKQSNGLSVEGNYPLPILLYSQLQDICLNLSSVAEIKVWNEHIKWLNIQNDKCIL